MASQTDKALDARIAYNTFAPLAQQAAHGIQRAAIPFVDAANVAKAAEMFVDPADAPRGAYRESLRQIGLETSGESARTRLAAQAMSQPGWKGAVARMIPGVSRAAGFLGSRALPVVNAGVIGNSIGSQIYDGLSRHTRDVIGGTINQAMQNLHLGGVDDGAYLLSTAANQNGLRRRQPMPTPSATSVSSAFSSGLPRRSPQAYTGSLDQQYNQALGTQPRYIASNAGTQRLNRLYDQSLGYTS